MLVPQEIAAGYVFGPVKKGLTVRSREDRVDFSLTVIFKVRYPEADRKDQDEENKNNVFRMRNVACRPARQEF